MIDDPNIDVLRQRIDDLDRKLLDLLKERLDVVHEVGEIKRKKSLKVFDPSREERLLKRLVDAAPDAFDEQSIRNIFAAIVRECRRLESEEIGES